MCVLHVDVSTGCSSPHCNRPAHTCRVPRSDICLINCQSEEIKYWIQAFFFHFRSFCLDTVKKSQIITVKSSKIKPKTNKNRLLKTYSSHLNCYKHSSVKNKMYRTPLNPRQSTYIVTFEFDFMF